MGKLLKYSLIGLIVIIIAFILIIVGVATDGWVFRSGVNYKVSLSSTTGDAKGEASYAFCIISTLFGGHSVDLCCSGRCATVYGEKERVFRQSSASGDSYCIDRWGHLRPYRGVS
ncbi:hypothetical protein BgiBS90_023129 [Biomphalaria glabrata]|uniref:Uncharacterized protein n=1 Tax=Biomphalaria glabrata TaxID=6526 RepID=A0A2C9LS06_BIOGL|nr:hypothetical protein BgiBS90_023129 [Biomphalaria glabrata]